MSDQDQQQQTGQQPAHTREPMTAERLAGIANTTKHARTVAGPFSIWMQVTADTDYLLAFAEAALPILRAVAGMDIIHSAHRCPGCERPIHYTSDPAQDTIDHALECPFVQARAQLGGND